MSAHGPALTIEADPLIAEARRRANLRRLLAVVVVLAAGAAAAATFSLRSSGAALGMCASPPSGWKERTIAKTSTTVATVVLTNFRFGQLDNFYGLAASGMRWPAGGAMIAVSNEGPDATPRFTHALRVGSGDFGGFEGMTWPAANVAVHSHGRVLDAYVELRTVTPATIAAVNQALAGVHACSA
jgi:hypothetical protein